MVVGLYQGFLCGLRQQSSTESVDNFVGKQVNDLAEPRKITCFYSLLKF